MGGEFEIDINALMNYNVAVPKEFRKGQFYSSGRAALYHILKFSRKHGKNKILLPDYLCDSIIETVRLLEITYEYYNINIDLSIDVDSVRKKYSQDCQVLIINYFGGVNIELLIEEIKKIDSKVSIILDNVQAFFNMFDQVDVDFAFTSFRKILPVPDGGWVLTKYDGLEQCNEENYFAQYKLAGGILKSFKGLNLYKDKMYLELFSKGEEEIKNNLNASISDSTLKLLNGFNLDFIKNKRIENANLVYAGLKKIGIKPLIKFEKEHVPLFIPILLVNRDSLKMELQKREIYCPIHWPRPSSIQNSDQKLYNTELSLLVDQRYDEEDMFRMLTIIEKFV